MVVETVPDDGKSKKTASSSRLRTLKTTSPAPKGPTEADLRKKDPEHAKKILESRVQPVNNLYGPVDKIACFFL
jgi:hypothetical protein